MTCKKGHECSRITAWRHFWGHHATGLLFSCHSLTSSYDTASFCHLMLLGTVFLISHKGLCEELWGNIFSFPDLKLDVLVLISYWRCFISYEWCELRNWACFLFWHVGLWNPTPGQFYDLHLLKRLQSCLGHKKQGLVRGTLPQLIHTVCQQTAVSEVAQSLRWVTLSTHLTVS